MSEMKDASKKSAAERLRMEDCPACDECRKLGANYCRKCGKQLRNPVQKWEPKACKAHE